MRSKDAMQSAKPHHGDGDGRTCSNANRGEPKASHEEENSREADASGKEHSVDSYEGVSHRVCSWLQLQTHLAS